MHEQPNVRAIFDRVLEIESAEERVAYLVQACGADEAVRREVETLLSAHSAAGEFLESSPAADLSSAADLDPPLMFIAPGTVIGRYKLLEPIGEGGYGTVFMAEQTTPVQRKVALKIIKAGMDTRQVIARFEAERQALALMDHPNIAKVFDAGVTDAGRPYFVMELVKGSSIIKYCDEHHLPPRARLEMFVQVCQAVQHAHQKGIIHRDLKPSNVLIALYDGKPVPKVIDFGVAKAAGQQLTERTMFTGFGDVIGTPQYMSPEQAELNQLDIDTRSDIYSLGVLLYELLTGTTPLESKRVKEVALLEILRVIREEEPPRPSTRLSTAAELPSIAAQRGLEPKSLSGIVKGELDWIVMKALEKDRTRRYETANGFASDVQRYLADEPVQACPPSAGYRLRKFVRRNKAAVAVAALVLSFLVLLGSGIGWAVRDQAARQSRIGAQVNLVLGEVEQLTKEQKWPEALAVARRAEALTTGEADGATQERVRQVLNDLQMVARLEELRLREARANGPGATIDEGLSDVYAAAFRDFGVDIEALPAEEAAARLRARPAVSIALAAALDDWARARRPKDREQSKRLWALATALDPDPWRVQVRQASAAMDVAALVKLAHAPEMARQPPQSQLLLASSLRLGDQPEQALALLERACESHPGDFWIHYVLVYIHYELAYNSTTRPDRVEAGVRHGIAARALRPRSANTWNLLGVLLYRLKKMDEAIAAYRKAIELDPKNASAYDNLGVVLFTQKKPDEAIAALRKAVELDPKRASAYSNLGAALGEQNKLDEAIAAFRKAIELDPKYAPGYSNLGIALYNRKKLDEAIAAFRKAIELDLKSEQAYLNLAAGLRDQGKLDEAIAAYRKAIELDPKFAAAYNNLGNILADQKKFGEAIAAWRKAIELDPKSANAYIGVGTILLLCDELKDYEQAVECFRKAVELDPKSAMAYGNLGVALSGQKMLDESVAAYGKAIELDPKFAPAYNNLGAALGEKPDEVIAAFRKAVEINPGTAAGVHAQIKQVSKGKEFDALRAREDFKKLVADVEAKRPLNDRAWDLATDPDPSLRNPTRAVELAEKAVAESPGNADYWNTLGVARYRNGDFEGAIAALQKFRELRTGTGEWNNPFFMAMAHWQLGKKDEARRWYEIAVNWMDKSAPKSETLTRFRAEAAELLGVKVTR